MGCGIVDEGQRMQDAFHRTKAFFILSLFLSVYCVL